MPKPYGRCPIANRGLFYCYEYGRPSIALVDGLVSGALGTPSVVNPHPYLWLNHNTVAGSSNKGNRRLRIGFVKQTGNISAPTDVALQATNIIAISGRRAALV